jgi:hypothetical protein
VVGGKYSQCNGGGQALSCISRCVAVQDQHAYYLDSLCP